MTPACHTLTYAKIAMICNYCNRRVKKKLNKKYKETKGSKTLSLRGCVSQILLEEYFKDSSGNSLR